MEKEKEKNTRDVGQCPDAGFKFQIPLKQREDRKILINNVTGLVVYLFVHAINDVNVGYLIELWFVRFCPQTAMFPL